LDLDATKDFTAIVRQSKEYTCGPAALATLMTQLGNNTSEEEILPQLQDLNIEK
jgi:predicted double-glycine peptidase